MLGFFESIAFIVTKHCLFVLPLSAFVSLNANDWFVWKLVASKILPEC